jgi:hypothetical protein
MRRAEHIARMGQKKNSRKIWTENLRGTDHGKVAGVNVYIILKLVMVK